MGSHSLALAAGMREESRTSGGLSGFETCLLGGGTDEDNTLTSSVHRHEHGWSAYRIIGAHLGWSEIMLSGGRND